MFDLSLFCFFFQMLNIRQAFSHISKKAHWDQVYQIKCWKIPISVWETSHQSNSHTSSCKRWENPGLRGWLHWSGEHRWFYHRDLRMETRLCKYNHLQVNKILLHFFSCFSISVESFSFSWSMGTARYTGKSIAFGGKGYT